MKKPASPSKTKSKGKTSTVGEVRIIGGQFRRRNVSFIDTDGLRPTPDRLRETLFNWLLSDIHGARVLDSCAGSGVLGFEALSRGAAHCTFIEKNLAQSKVLTHTAQQLKVEANNYQILCGAAEQILHQNQAINPPFNIVFVDPPYAQDLWQPILTALIKQQLIDNNSVIYLEADKDLTQALNELTEKLKQNESGIIFQGFDTLKQTQVGQVVAGLYQLISS